jgi:hypothetical protein
MPDKRWKPELWKGSVSATIPRLDISAYDLIFIDDSADAISRSHTLQAVYARRPHCPVVIHDAELWQYRTRIWAHPPVVIFDVFNPQTAVCLPRHSAQLAILRNSRRALRSLATAGQTAGNLGEWETVGRRAVQRLYLDPKAGAVS